MRNGDQDPGPQAVAELDPSSRPRSAAATGCSTPPAPNGRRSPPCSPNTPTPGSDQLTDAERKHATAAAKALDQAATGIDATAHTRAVARWLGDANKALNRGTVGGNQTPRRFPNPGTAKAGSTAVNATGGVPHDTGWYLATLREWLHHP